MEEEVYDEYELPNTDSENIYESICENHNDYIQRPPLPLPRIEGETSSHYDQAWNHTKPIQSDNTEVKQVIDNESAETLNDKTGPTKERISWKTKFVHGESLQPTDDDHGVHVWEPQCYPSGNHAVPKDTDHLVECFNNSSDRHRESFAITITSYVIPHYYKENNIIGLAKLTRCKCNDIQILALNRIVDMLFRHRISSCPGYKLLDCADIIWGSFRNNLRHNYIRHVSYVMVLLLSTVYLWGISNPDKWDKEAPNVKATLKRYISGFPDQSLCSSLDESSKSLLWALECFIHCLEDNCLRSSTLQIGEWEQSMLLEENRSIIECKIFKMVYSEQIVLSVLLLNLLNRVPDSSGHISTLLLKCMTCVLRCTKCKLCSLSWKQKLSGKKDKHYQQRRRHLSANLVVTGLIRAIQNIIYNKSTHNIMKDIIESCAAASSLTKQMLLTELEKLYFNKQDFVRFYGIELLGVEGNIEKICRGYIARSLSVARLSFREDGIGRSSNVGHPFWIVMFGKLGDIQVKINCLIPTKHCVFKLFSEDYTKKADRHQTADNWNTFVTLKKIQCSGGHGNIVKLLAYQYFPLPFFFILENQPNTNFLEWLLSHRNKTTWIRSETLIFMIKDIVSAVRFLHKNGILHRDLTAYRCVILDQSPCVKLHQFRLAKIQTVTGDESRFAARWMAPESMINGTFSQQTDTWMVGLFMWEVLTHGCWPFTEHSDKTTDMIMELLVYRHLRPAQFPCIPDKLYELILRCLHQDPNSRITLDKLEDELISIMQTESPLSPGMTGVITPNWSQRKRRYPYILKEQNDRCEKEDFEPEMGIPQCIIRQTSKVSYVNVGLGLLNTKTVLPITEEDLISDDQPQIQWSAMVHVSEPVTNGTFPYNDDFKRISGALKLEVKMEINGDKIMNYTYPNGDTLLNLVLRRVHGTNTDKYIQILLNIVKCVERFHSHGWIVRCITARDICVTEDTKICFLRLGRTALLDDPDEDWLFDDVFKDRFNWLPLEVIRDKMYSRKSDVYMVAMTAYEMFSALDLHLSDPVKNQLGCIPFAVHTKDMILDVLSCNQVPERPDSCPKWLYEILQKCWYTEQIRRLTITDLISQIEETWLLHCKMNEEKQTPFSTSHYQEDVESPPDVPSRIFHQQKALYRSFGSTMSFAPLPPPCTSLNDNRDRVSGIISVSDVNQFTLGSNDFSSDNYPDETYFYDDLLSARSVSKPRKAADNTLKKTKCSALTTDQRFSDMNESVQMRTERGRRQRLNDPSVKYDLEMARLKRKSELLFNFQLMVPSSPSISSQEDVSLHYENDSDSDTSTITSATHDSQGTSSTDYAEVYSMPSNLSSDASTIHNNSDFSIVHAQNCTPSDESYYEVVTGDQNYCSERMPINNTVDPSSDDPSDVYLTATRRSQQEYALEIG